MFNFGNANENQKRAISTTEGPVLITAGPGTGKTFTLVQRAIYLIEECNVRPEEILIATFTEKAAKEVITRITNELYIRGISVNVNEMYIGTFHSICLRILKENIEYTRLKKNYRTLDDFEQKYMVFQNIYRFRNIENLENVLDCSGAWRQSEAICKYVNSLSEEMVDFELLKEDRDTNIASLGFVMEHYQHILEENNMMDFAAIQTEAYTLLRNNDKVLIALQDKLKYLMIDEYQDTNFIQEQIIFLLAGSRKNICVVGDDDQGLYRFRGATIRNILEFPSKFEKGRCQIIPLDINYRSNKDIVNFYNRWMSTTDGAKFKFSWDKYRYSKKIKPYRTEELDSPAVVKLSGKDDEVEWHQKILKFIMDAKDSGKLQDYNQIAFLFRSVKSDNVVGLANFLEENGINVYSPRSNMFFEREEIKIAIGCLMFMFPRYISALENGEHKFINRENIEYYVDCLKAATELLSKPESAELRRWLKQHGLIHVGSFSTLDYSYSGLLYQMFAFEPFKAILSVDMGSGVVDKRPARNLARLSQIIVQYEYLHRIDVLTAKNIDKHTSLLFNLYMKFLFDGGINEYEDDSEYAPSGCVSFLTIHQSKGMEFPIVIVDSLGSVPRKNGDELIEFIEDKYYQREPYEPREITKYFDFWRLYYTAFSRAQDLLVLTCNETKRCPSLYIKELYDELPDAEGSGFDIKAFNFKDIKPTNIKETFSFTSHVLLYEACALQYKFYKELEFTPVRVSAMLFGRLIHETIEDIHRAALRGEAHTINEENITKWFNSNYVTLSKIEHQHIAQPQQQAALKQVLRYAERNNGRWEHIQQAEVDVSLVKPDYIIEGTIDLIKGEGNTVEIVDFKSEKKPDIVRNADRLEQYRRQLHIYAHLVEERTGQKVSKMHLYYTGEENGVPTITFPYTKSAVEGTLSSFDSTVHKILNKDYRKCSDDAKLCGNCDFRFYCGRAINR